MKFNELPKLAQNEELKSLLRIKCQGCEYEHNCSSEWKKQCKAGARQVAIEHGESNGGYVLINGLNGLEYMERCFIDDDDEVIRW